MSVWATVRFTPRDNGRFVSAVVSPAVRASVAASAALVESRAKELCPVDTGRLRDSIFTRTVESEQAIRAYVAPNTPYAGYVEFGTGIRGAASPGAGSGPYSATWLGMPAQPFMRPAIDEAREPIRELFRANLSATITSPYA